MSLNPIVAVLEQAGVDMRDGPTRSEIRVCCPFCVERGEKQADTRFRLGINIESGIAHDYNCHWSSRAGVLGIARLLASAYRIRFVFGKRYSTKVRKQVKETPRAGKRLPKEYESFADGHGDTVAKRAKAYLESRGISTLQTIKHKIGFAAAGPLAWRVLFPVVDESGAIAGCVGRDFSGMQRVKYLNTKGIKLLWNAHTQGSVAVVVEGVIDALRVETALMQMRGYVALAQLGSAVTPQQLHQLQKYSKLIVFPDRDRAGVRGALGVCAAFAAHGLSTSVVVPSEMDGKDPGDMTEEEIADVIAGAVPWTDTTARRLRLSMIRGSILD